MRNEWKLNHINPLPTSDYSVAQTLFSVYEGVYLFCYES
jgi:hypothetical protein